LILLVIQIEWSVPAQWGVPLKGDEFNNFRSRTCGVLY
jgi:hypothetical protein